MRGKHFIILAFFFLVASSFYFVPRLLKIREVSCRSQYSSCAEFLENKIKKVEGESLENAYKDISKVLKNEVLVESFTIQFKLPNKLQVEVIVRKPKFALKNVNQEGYAMVGKNKIVVAVVPSTNLPTLKIPTTIPNVGEEVGEKQFFALEILNSMFYLYQIREGEIEGESLVVNSPSGVKIIFPLAGDKDALIGAARIILSKLNEKGENSRIKNVTIVDLRFKNPVLK